MKFYDFVTHDPKIQLLSPLCGTFHFIPSLLYLFLPSSMLTFLHFFRLSILLIIFCVFHGFLALFSIHPNELLIVPKKCFYFLFLFFHCTSAFPISPLSSPSVSSRVSFARSVDHILLQIASCFPLLGPYDFLHSSAELCKQ